MLIYLHIPFCDSKCFYCAFNSYVDKFDLKASYMDAVIKQLEYEIERFDLYNSKIDSIFIGGGTPSTIKPKLYEKLFFHISKYIKNDIEITVEANPNSASAKWLKGMKELGINRVSFGVQSFNEKKLKFLGRNHSNKMAKEAILNADLLGFKNISLDLIYGTKLDTKKLLLNDLKIAKNLPINHISAYSLTIEKNTPFYKKQFNAKESPLITKFFIDEIIKSGFPQYEISNFGQYKSKHNLGYWMHKNYIGLGAGAVGFLNNIRFYPYRDIEKYIKNPIYTKEEMLDKEALHIEKLFLGFRSMIGVPLFELKEQELKRVKILLKEKKLLLKEGRIFNKNYLLSDEIVLFITSLS